MTLENEIQAQFLKDIATHEMTILSDCGVFRCIRFADTQSTCMHFTLTTWPDHIAISGDMGNFVFSRIKDMFSFFRDREMEINPGYWAEKCVVAADSLHGIREFDPGKLRNAVIERFKDHFEDTDIEEAMQCWEELCFDVLSSESTHEAYENARDFEFGGFALPDFCAAEIESKTFNYLWCLYAIVWGIQKFDKVKNKQK